MTLNDVSLNLFNFFYLLLSRTENGKAFEERKKKKKLQVYCLIFFLTSNSYKLKMKVVVDFHFRFNGFFFILCVGVLIPLTSFPQYTFFFFLNNNLLDLIFSNPPPLSLSFSFQLDCLQIRVVLNRNHFRICFLIVLRVMLRFSTEMMKEGNFFFFLVFLLTRLILTLEND